MPEFGPDALRTRRCECGAADCTADIQISWAEQDLGDHPGCWLLHPDHEIRGARSFEVITLNERFKIVSAVERNDEGA
jgi:hypothetical protein